MRLEENRYKVLRYLGCILSDPEKWFDHTLDHTSSTQWPQTCTEAATKCYNYTVNGADEEREHRLPTLQKAMGRSGNAYSLQQIIFFHATISSNSYTICTMQDARISYQRTEDSLSAFTPWATLGFTVSYILQSTVYNTDNVGKRYICKRTLKYRKRPYWTQFSFTIFITFTSPKPSHVKICIYV